jgi:Tol biopolymer transport system component/DNA-binding winged helix-turn-helix (wHTH) protein
MNQRIEFPPPFRLGPWLVQPDLNRISGEGGDHRIEPLVMRVLQCLADRPGEVWSRQDLLDEVWNESVVGEEILTRAISELRRVFGDKARDPRFIETIRNHGYRLIETPDRELEEKPSPIPLEDPPPRQSSPEPTLLRRYRILLLLVPLLILVGFFGRGMFNDPSDSDPKGIIYGPAVPLTSFPGREWHPALSADGTRVAFVWSGPEEKSTDIYVKQRNSESLLRLTNTASWVAWPTWSPDGQTVAFVQRGPEGGILSLVPSLGGAVQNLLNVPSWVEGLDFAPDGKSLVYAARGTDAGKYGLYRLNLQSLEVQQPVLNDESRAGDFQPRFSPDGKSLAWVGVGLDGQSGLYWSSFSDPSAHRVGSDFANLQGLAFSPDGKHLVFSASPAGAFHLWMIPVAGGVGAIPELVPTPGEFAWNPSIARQKGDLVFEQVQVNQDIWQIRIIKDDPWEMETSAFLQSTRWEYQADFSPQGAQVAFISARSGTPEVWLADSDGKNPRKVTSLGQGGLTNLRWSPDGQWLAFNALQEQHSVIMVLAVRGGEPRVLTPAGAGELFFSWSQNGESLLYGLREANGWEIWRRNLKDDTIQRITSLGAIAAKESSDGRTLLFTRPEHSGLWALSLDESGRGFDPPEPEMVLEDLSSQDLHNWVLNQNQVFWVYRPGGRPMLAMTDFISGHSNLLTEMPDLTGNGLAVSPEGTTVLYAKTSRMEGDLMVLEAANREP